MHVLGTAFQYTAEVRSPLSNYGKSYTFPLLGHTVQDELVGMAPVRLADTSAPLRDKIDQLGPFLVQVGLANI